MVQQHAVNCHAEDLDKVLQPSSLQVMHFVSGPGRGVG